MKKFLKEFREFALESDVMDLAIAVIMGNATSKMVTALVESILSPLLGIFLGGQDFANLSFGLGSAQIMYGRFIQAVIDFVVIAFCVFLMLKLINTVKESLQKDKEAQAAAQPAAPTTDQLLTEIRDLLKEQEKQDKK